MSLIYINGRFLTQPVTGVQRYALELIRHMDQLLDDNVFAPEIELVCLVPPQDFPNPPWKHIEVRTIGRNGGNLWEQLDLPLYLKGQLLFSPTNIGPWHYANQVVTLHDASVFAFPEAYSFAFRAKYKFVFKQLAKRAALLLTDSTFSQQELAHHLEVAPGRFTVVPLGSDHLESVQADRDVLNRNNLEAGSYLLLVASRSKHKNNGAAIKAVEVIESDIRLVVVGGNFQGVFKKIDSVDIPSNMLTLGYVNDRELKALYENALGFIFPSLYEGFGLPVLEAMRAGCPVISSHAASLPEVAGDAALYFDPGDVEDMARVIERFLSDPALQEDMRHKGFLQAKYFKWSTTARRILESMLDVLYNNEPPG